MVDEKETKKDKRRFINIGEASEITGIGIQTIRKMVDENEIQSYRTVSGHRKIDKSSLLSMFSNAEKSKPKRNFLYTRVSSKKQLGDLARQVEYIQRPEYSEYNLIQDVGSGINFKRKGLQAILDSCIQGNIGEVVVAHKDRLSRFGYDLIELFVLKAGGKITLLDVPENKSSEQELADDLLSIVHIFSCKQMGKRTYKKTTGVQDDCSKGEIDNASEKTL